MMPTCAVCGGDGLLAYTQYERDRPIACRHRTEFVECEPDSEVGMDEPLRGDQ